MDKLGIMRLGTVCIIALVSIFQPKHFTDFVMIVSLAHYVMAAIYSKNHYGFGTFKPLAVVSLAVAAVVMYKLKSPITIIFGIHNVFTEVYLSHASVPSSLWRKMKPMRIATLAFNSCIYLALLRNDPYFPILNSFGAYFLVGTLITGVYYYWMLFQTHGYLTGRQIFNLSLVESVNMVLLLLSPFIHLNLFDFIGYHVTFWTIYPIPGLVKKRALSGYAILTVSMLLLFFLLSPVGLRVFSVSIWLKMFIIGGLMHISTSLALTKVQPGWITQIFSFGSPGSGPAADVTQVPVLSRK